MLTINFIIINVNEAILQATSRQKELPLVSLTPPTLAGSTRLTQAVNEGRFSRTNVTYRENDNMTVRILMMIVN